MNSLASFAAILHGTSCKLLLLLWLLFSPPLQAGELVSYPEATYVPTEFNDGDSFKVRYRATGAKRATEDVVRLYFVDCPELSFSAESDRRRLLEQSRYFGCEEPRHVVRAGEAARDVVKALLDQPFTLHTAKANALGRSKKPRIYGMITLADGRDLAKVLVESGLARPKGITRGLPDGTRGDSYKEHLHDVEFAAALNRKGIWGYNNPTQIVDMRAKQRREEDQLDALKLGVFANVSEENPIDINKAEAEQLQQLSGIGTELANRIIKSRPYKSVDDLLRVQGIGPVILERSRPFVKVGM